MLDQTRDHRPHAVVIGAGFGGLAAAVRLGARGFRVTVLDRLDAPGGRAYVHRQDGFTFDAGPTIVTAPYLFEELWSLCGRRMEDDVDLVALDPCYKIRFDDGSVFSYSADAEKMRAEVARFEPRDVAGYDRFMDLSRRIFDVGFTELADTPFHSLPLMLRCFPAMIKLGGHRSVLSVVSKYFRDPKLRIVFSFHPLLIGGNPLTAPAYYCLISHLEREYGVHFAKGGTGALVRGLEGLVRGQGGLLRYGSDVRRILVENGKAAGVELTGGERIDADVVVSNADAAFTYGALLKEHARKRWGDGKLGRSQYSMSLFVWYFGTDRRYEDVYHHTKVLGPRYEGLLKDIFARKSLADDMSLYLHRPTATDPSLAPAGCDAFYALSPVPHLESGTDWAEMAEPYRKRIEQRLEETMLPGLSRAVVTSRLLTPIDFRDRLKSPLGAAFGLEPRLFQSAWFRPHNRSEEVPGLYLVGAGTHPGAGMPGVLCSAKIADKLIAPASAFA